MLSPPSYPRSFMLQPSPSSLRSLIHPLMLQLSPHSLRHPLMLQPSPSSPLPHASPSSCFNHFHAPSYTLSYSNLPHAPNHPPPAPPYTYQQTLNSQTPAFHAHVIMLLHAHFAFLMLSGMVTLPVCSHAQIITKLFQRLGSRVRDEPHTPTRIMTLFRPVTCPQTDSNTQKPVAISSISPQKYISRDRAIKNHMGQRETSEQSRATHNSLELKKGYTGIF